MEISVVYITTQSRSDSLRLAQALLSEHLIACANIIDGMTSLYRWNSQLHEDSESVLIVKTRSSLVSEVTRRVKELHTYDCPCVVAWAATNGNEEYFDWVRKETSMPE